jgi:hypothetical protein
MPSQRPLPVAVQQQVLPGVVHAQQLGVWRLPRSLLHRRMLRVSLKRLQPANSATQPEVQGQAAVVSPCDGTNSSLSWCCGNKADCCARDSTKPRYKIAKIFGQAVVADNSTSTSVVTSSSISSSTTTASAAATSKPSSTAAAAANAASSGLSTGAKAGIGVGAAIGVIALIAVGVLIGRRSHNKNQPVPPHEHTGYNGHHDEPFPKPGTMYPMRQSGPHPNGYNYQYSELQATSKPGELGGTPLSEMPDQKGR